MPCFTGRDALHLAQNRLREKTLAARLGIQTPSFWAVRSADDLASALSDLKGRGVLKTTEQGYDGKGQILIATGDDATSCWSDVNTNEAILESFIDFTAEVSFLVWRDARGQTGVFPAARNIHKNGILATSIGPADGLDPATLKDGADAAISLAEAINLHGVMAMESFVSHTGQIIFNEIAPRPHNSFHWTIEGCVTSQFAQLVRIISGLGPGDTSARGSWQMENLLGEDLHRLPALYANASKTVHLYGKVKRAAAAKWDMSPGSCGKSTPDPLSLLQTLKRIGRIAIQIIQPVCHQQIGERPPAVNWGTGCIVIRKIVHRQGCVQPGISITEIFRCQSICIIFQMVQHIQIS